MKKIIRFLTPCIKDKDKDIKLMTDIMRAFCAVVMLLVSVR